MNWFYLFYFAAILLDFSIIGLTTAYTHTQPGQACVAQGSSFYLAFYLPLPCLLPGPTMVVLISSSRHTWFHRTTCHYWIVLYRHAFLTFCHFQISLPDCLLPMNLWFRLVLRPGL